MTRVKLGPSNSTPPCIEDSAGYKFFRERSESAGFAAKEYLRDDTSKVGHLNTVTHFFVAGANTISGEEVIINTLITSKAERFVGNGYSNPSIMIYYMGEWK